MVKIDAECLDELFPCSGTVAGNLVLMVFYGFLLMQGSKMIAAGSELLLVANVAPGIVGGLLLPILGAVPDSALVLAATLSAKGDDVSEQVGVAVGTLAGSTIMLTTLSLGICIIIGRCDIDSNGFARDNRRSRKSWFTTGVTYLPDVLTNSKIMLLTSLTYLIIQIPGFIFMNTNKPANKEHIYAWIGCVICLITLAVYSIFMIKDSAARDRRAKEACRRHVINEAFSHIIRSTSRKENNQGNVSDINESMNEDIAALMRVGVHHHHHVSEEASIPQQENQPLLGNSPVEPSKTQAQQHAENMLVSKMGLKWKKNAVEAAARREKEDAKRKAAEKKAAKKGISPADVEVPSDSESEDEFALQRTWPRGKIIRSALMQMLAGVGIVTIFSDPMCAAITNFAKLMDLKPFYVSFIVTPVASNASEVISSIIFASRRKTENMSITISALFGAAICNATFVLGVFLFLIAYKRLAWTYSAEVCAIMFITVIMGTLTVTRRTLKTWMSIPIMLLYPISIAMVSILEGHGFR